VKRLISAWICLSLVAGLAFDPTPTFAETSKGEASSSNAVDDGQRADAEKPAAESSVRQQFPTLAFVINDFESRFSSPDFAVRINLIDDIGDLLPFREAEKALMVMLQDADPSVQLEAATWLSELEYILPERFAIKFLGFKSCCDNNLNHLLGTPCTSQNCFKEKEFTWLQRAREIGEFGDQSGRQELLECLQNSSVRVRVVAANSLARLGYKDESSAALKEICLVQPENELDCAALRTAFLSRIRMHDDDAHQEFINHLDRMRFADEDFAQQAYVVGLRILENLHGVCATQGMKWFFWVSDRTDDDGTDLDSRAEYRPVNRARRELTTTI
jgi:hypothetical protein